MKYDKTPLWHRARLSPIRLWRYRAWRAGHLASLLCHRAENPQRPIHNEDKHLCAAIRWLLQSQDQSTDGGFIGRYRYDSGWTTSYPETTGYIIPTLLSVAKNHQVCEAGSFDPGDLVSRAQRAAHFLIDLQFDSGAFPAGEIGPTVKQASPFNTAQIINGLQAWHQHSGDDAFLDAARRAADWLVAEQDSDGAWRKWFYHNIPAVYCTHLSCWLAELGVYTGEEKYKQSAEKNAHWVLAQQDKASGFFDGCGFTEEEQQLRIADLHTIAYNQGGLIRIARALESEEILTAVAPAANGVLATLERLGWIPGVLNHQWQSKANSTCLTGCAQMALVWLDLYEINRDKKYWHGAEQALNFVKRGQIIESTNPALVGAIPGSDPLWGWYNDGILPNWSAKFFIDALLQKRKLENERSSD